jgi:antitoxin CptB
VAVDVDPDLSRTLWRCRRGMRELDMLLHRYAEKHYPAMDAADRATFERFLEAQDADIYAWFIGREAPPDAPLAEFVGRILASRPELAD